MSWNIEWTQEKKDATCAALEAWLRKHCKHYCAGESIGQDDDCQIYASVLIGDVVDDILKPVHDDDEDDF